MATKGATFKREYVPLTEEMSEELDRFIEAISQHRPRPLSRAQACQELLYYALFDKEHRHQRPAIEPQAPSASPKRKRK